MKYGRNESVETMSILRRESRNRSKSGDTEREGIMQTVQRNHETEFQGQQED